VHNWNPYLSVAVVSIVLATLALMGSRSKHETWGNDEIYRYPPAIGYLLLGGAVFMCVLPLLFARDTPQPTIVLVWLAGGAGLAVAMYFFRYRVTVGSSTLEFGAWNAVSIPISDIVDTDVVTGRSRMLIVYLRDGRRLMFSGTLGDFPSLAATLARRAASGGPTAQKLEDQRRRTSTVRRLNWVAVMLVVLFPVLRLLTDLHRADGHLSPVPATLQRWLCAVPALAPYLDCIELVSGDPRRARLASAALLAAQQLDLPVTDEVTALITSQQFAEFEKRSRRYESGFTTDPAYESPLQKLYAAICASNPEVAAALDEWVHERPSYMSYAARGIYETNLGYRQRGEKFLKDTPPENLRRMEESFQRARGDLAAALKLNPKFIPAYTALILIAQADGERAEAQRIESEATREVPSTYYVRYSYIMTLRPEWGGSYAAMRAYAASLTGAAMLNPRIWSLQGDEWSQRGRQAWVQGDERRALEYYSNALRYGDRLEFLENRGFLYVNTRQYELALRDFDRYREYSTSNQNVNDYTQCIEDYRAGRGCHLNKPAAGAAERART
jgi:tetratricopeptide (TPR) repeat protein